MQIFVRFCELLTLKSLKSLPIQADPSPRDALQYLYEKQGPEETI